MPLRPRIAGRGVRARGQDDDVGGDRARASTVDHLRPGRAPVASISTRSTSVSARIVRFGRPRAGIEVRERGAPAKCPDRVHRDRPGAAERFGRVQIRRAAAAPAVRPRQAARAGSPTGQRPGRAALAASRALARGTARTPRSPTRRRPVAAAQRVVVGGRAPERLAAVVRRAAADHLRPDARQPGVEAPVVRVEPAAAEVRQRAVDPGVEQRLRPAPVVEVAVVRARPRPGRPAAPGPRTGAPRARSPRRRRPE